MGDMAGMIRIFDVMGGETKFVDLHHVQIALEKAFARERHTPPEIFAWTLETIGWIHPFFDGNRRTLWTFTNLWLLSLGFPPMPWHEYRPQWEKDIDLSGNERLHNIVSYYKNQLI